MTDFDALVKPVPADLPMTEFLFLTPLSCYKGTMQKAAELHMPISLHEEDKAFITNNGINAGEISTQLGVAGSPANCRRSDGCPRLHACASKWCRCRDPAYQPGNSVELVRTARKLGADIHAEATPHHFYTD